MIVDHDPVHRQSGGLCSRGLSARDSLGADPDFTAILADMNRAVHRLHRGMRKEWELDTIASTLVTAPAIALRRRRYFVPPRPD